MELISTIGTRVYVDPKHAETLLAAGYTQPNHDSTPKPGPPPARRKTTRAAHRSGPTEPADPDGPA